MLPSFDVQRERGGTHDKDGFVLSAHPGKSQGRPRTTSSSQLISQNGLPLPRLPTTPRVPGTRSSRRGRTAVSCPDNGSCYRSEVHALALQELGIRHLFTRPYRPRTNGKAERFIQTLTNRWAYGAIYGSSTERTAALKGWLTHYNFTRPHGSLSHKPPGARLHQLTNLARNYS